MLWVDDLELDTIPMIVFLKVARRRKEIEAIIKIFINVYVKTNNQFFSKSQTLTLTFVHVHVP